MPHAIGAFRRAASVPASVLEFPWQGASDEGGTLVALAGLVVVALLALVVAASADNIRRPPRRRGSADSVQLSLREPLSIPGAGPPADADEVPPHLVYDTPRLPRWVQLGSIVVALGITWTVAQRLLPRADRAVDETGKAASAARPPAAAQPPSSGDAVPFAFHARAWTSEDSGCRSALEVTEGSATPYELTLTVHDTGGRSLGTASARVASLREGERVDFRLPGVACDRIAAWEVRGHASPP